MKNQAQSFPLPVSHLKAEALYVQILIVKKWVLVFLVLAIL